MTKEIEIELQESYNWKYTQTNDEVLVTFSFPSTFPLDSFKVILKDNINISCFSDSYIPFLEGTLQEEITSTKIELNHDDHSIILHLFKKYNEKWQILIKSYDSNNKIDPKSAYTIFLKLSNDPDSLEPDLITEIYQLLKLSVDYDYQPAVITYTSILMNNSKNFEQVESLLNRSIEKYKNPDAYLTLGTHFLNINNKNEGMKLITKAYELGSHNASYVLGKIYSPFSDLDGGVKKDGRTAIDYLKQNNSAQSIYEIAKIYYRGCDGVEQNMSNALVLYDSVKKELDYLPSLEEATKPQPTKKNYTTMIIIIISILILIISVIIVKKYL